MKRRTAILSVLALGGSAYHSAFRRRECAAAVHTAISHQMTESHIDFMFRKSRCRAS